MRYRAMLLVVLASLCTLLVPAAIAAPQVRPLKAGVWYDDTESVALFGGHAGMQTIARAMVAHQNEAFRDSGLARTGPTTGYGMDLTHVGVYHKTVGCDLLAIAQEFIRGPRWVEVKEAQVHTVVILVQCKREVHGWNGISLTNPLSKAGFKNPQVGVVVMLTGGVADTDGTVYSALFAHEFGHALGLAHAVPKSKSLGLAVESGCPWESVETASLFQEDVDAVFEGRYVFKDSYRERLNSRSLEKAAASDPNIGKTQWPWARGIILPAQPGEIPVSDAMGTGRVLAGNWYSSPRRCPDSLPSGTVCGVKNSIDASRGIVTNWAELYGAPAIRLKTPRIP